MKKLALTAACLMGFCASAQAATLQNGSFEMSGYSGPFATYAANSGNLAGWTIESGSVDLINTLWQHSDGFYSLDMDGNAPATISQTVTGLEIGRSYSVLFDMASNPAAAGATLKNLNVSIGAASDQFTFDRTGKSTSNMGWTTMELEFTATATDMLLTFASASRSGPFGPALDNVRINAAPVPLPAGGVLLLSAFGLMGLRKLRNPA